MLETMTATYYEMAPAYQLGLHLAMGLEQETRWGQVKLLDHNQSYDDDRDKHYHSGGNSVRLHGRRSSRR